MFKKGKRISLLILLVLVTSMMQVALWPTASAETLFTEGFDNMLVGAVSPLGDYNRNGIVDAPDYTVWRDQFGTVVYPGFGADGNNSGGVDPFDRLVWRANYGGTSSGAGTSLVPEPGAIGLAIAVLTLGAVLIRHRR